MAYQSILSLIDTEIAINSLKNTFQNKLAASLNLLRVSAPLFVRANSGLNDELSGSEKPVTFTMKHDTETISIVQSLAKWKRHALKHYQIPSHMGLYTDMNAIRKDEDLDCLHSLYVDQWDWEKIILKEERHLSYLFATVETIYQVIVDTQKHIIHLFPQLTNFFTPSIIFISSSDLANTYPALTPKQREYAICKQHGSVFIYQIGGPLSNGEATHDSRAPDYDDWNLNGDILVYYPPLDCAIELSSMGIRVDEDSLIKQLTAANKLESLQYRYHQQIVEKQLPYTIGGGIGQSRLCMIMLNKKHIGEVQASVWDKKTLDDCKKDNIFLL